jgi:Fur family transcriptional regulator, iron response regulator
MPTRDVIALLRKHEIQATPQRIAVAESVLWAKTHPTADEVWTAVKRKHPTVSRATIYNTLNLFVEKQLLRTHVLSEGTTVFDPNIELHHHFIDEETGEVHDVPWRAVKVTGENSLRGFDVREYQVVMRGRKRRR